jgi:hypothetical protein
LRAGDFDFALAFGFVAVFGFDLAAVAFMRGNLGSTVRVGPLRTRIGSCLREIEPSEANFSAL